MRTSLFYKLPKPVTICFKLFKPSFCAGSSGSSSAQCQVWFDFSIYNETSPTYFVLAEVCRWGLLVFHTVLWPTSWNIVVEHRTSGYAVESRYTDKRFWGLEYFIPSPGEVNKLFINIVSYPTSLFIRSCCHLDKKKEVFH